jgi:uncharacterized DUF497 family protein
VQFFEWDDANLLHIDQHDVSADEAEHALTHGSLDVKVEVRESEERFVQVGATGRGRILRLISVVRGNTIRVVTAFDAPRRDRRLFERWRGESYGTKT